MFAKVKKQDIDFVAFGEELAFSEAGLMEQLASGGIQASPVQNPAERHAKPLIAGATGGFAMMNAFSVCARFDLCAP